MFGVTCALTLALSLVTACKTARYEFAGKKGKSGADGNNSGADDTVGPKPSSNPGSDDATPQLPPDSPGENMDNTPLELPPTARVEVIDGGKIISTAPINKKVTVTPSQDTMDGDNAADPGNCPNPGIIEAKYDFGDGTTRSVKREPSDCRTLSVEYAWKSAGLYEIKLVVVSDEKEEAQAALSFRVTQTTPPPAAQSSSFRVDVIPSMTTPGSKIVATGTCTTPSPNRISWDFGDGLSSSGQQANHAYTNNGQYIVTGLCVDQSGLTLESSATVLVSKKIPTPSPSPTQTPNPNQTPTPTQTPTGTGTPGQNPVQTPGQN